MHGIHFIVNIVVLRICNLYKRESFIEQNRLIMLWSIDFTDHKLTMDLEHIKGEGKVVKFIFVRSNQIHFDGAKFSLSSTLYRGSCLSFISKQKDVTFLFCTVSHTTGRATAYFLPHRQSQRVLILTLLQVYV